MWKFISFSIGVHLIIFYANLHYKVRYYFEEFKDNNKSKIRVLKVRDKKPEKFHFEKFEKLHTRLLTYIKDSVKPPVLLDKEEKPVRTQQNVLNNFTTRTINISNPPSYMLPVYSSGKLTLKEKRTEQAVNINNNQEQSISRNEIYRIKEDINKNVKSVNKSDEDFKRYIQMYRDEVFTIVYRKFEKYTKNKKFKNKNDSVVLIVNINQDGKILNIDIQHPSMDDKFNKLCVDIIKEIGRFPPFPKVLDIDVIKLTIPFKVRLP